MKAIGSIRKHKFESKQSDLFLNSSKCELSNVANQQEDQLWGKVVARPRPTHKKPWK